MAESYIVYKLNSETGEVQEVTGGYYVSPEQAEERKKYENSNGAMQQTVSIIGYMEILHF